MEFDRVPVFDASKELHDVTSSGSRPKPRRTDVPSVGNPLERSGPCGMASTLSSADTPGWSSSLNGYVCLSRLSAVATPRCRRGKRWNRADTPGHLRRVRVAFHAQPQVQPISRHIAHILRARVPSWSIRIFDSSGGTLKYLPRPLLASRKSNQSRRGLHRRCEHGATQENLRNDPA
jgi:hypothetical protein